MVEARLRGSCHPPAGRRLHTVAVLGLLALSGLPALPAAGATQEVVPDRGVVEAGLLFRQLDGVKRVLLLGAHPDDEDTALLATLARGMGAETAYLSLTRGDGGQNLIGPELDEGLGVVRTGELLAARSLDGGLQFFTRAFDYGYSKSAEEAFTQWPREELLRDVVWVVRKFRPQVIVSIFSGTPADGHGQHQAAGILAREAFFAAGDPARFPDQLAEGVATWRPAKLYRRFRRVADAPSLEVEVGAYDPLLGRSHYQLAMASRSRHRSQDMGVPQPLGPRTSSLYLVEAAAGVEAGPAGGLFAGVDTALAAHVDGLPGEARSAAGAGIERYREALAEARREMGALEPWRAAPALARALRHLEAARAAAGRAPGGAEELLDVLDRRTRLAGEALLEAAGVVVDARVADDLVVPGQTVRLEVTVWNGGPWPVARARPEPDLPAGWTATAVPSSAERDDPGSFFARGGDERVADGPSAVPPGESVVWRWDVALPPDADLSRPYYLERPRDGALYRWPDDRGVRALPRRPPVLHAGVGLDLRVALDGDTAPSPVDVRRAARYVGVDKAAGEYEEPLLVVPAVSVATEPRVMVVPTGSTGGSAAREVGVSLETFAPGGAEGALVLRAPVGWTVEPAAVPFAARAEGQGASATFTVRPPADAAPGRYALKAEATTADGRAHAEAMGLVDYPHIERAALFAPSVTRVTVVDVAVDPGLAVGYVMGSGDDGDDALRELGVDVTLLGPADLREGDLSRFDALVLGIRAYEVRPDLAAANERVLDFARAGGTVLVQYNKYELPAGGYAPYPVDMSRPHDRVTDEGSPFRLIHPDNPVFTVPNRIGAADFEGWVSERGLYFLGEWDERMTPLLELTDPGEEPKRGSIVVAPVGEGLWIYTGLSFFRQLPEGVPGAYRLFANLVSLDRGEWRDWEVGR